MTNSAKTRHPAGFTFMELMISVAVLSVAAVGLIGGIAGLARSVQISKNKTLAANLAQEKMQIIKQKNYYQVIATPNPDYNASYNPPIPYDNLYFPLENITEGSVSFKRMTYIQVAMEDSGNLVTLPPTTPDTGMRLITITITWVEGGQNKMLKISSILSNINTVMTNSTITGTVKSSASSATITGALVNVAENLGWRDSTNASGVYNMNLSPGNFTIVASALGYFPKMMYLSMTPNSAATQNFFLDAMGTGTVNGTAWVTPTKPYIITQVVSSTFTYIPDLGSQQDVEYVELLNPTTSPYSFAYIVLYNYRHNGMTDSPLRYRYTYGYPWTPDPTWDYMSYRSTYIPAQSYFLIANTSMSFTLFGSTIAADAWIDSFQDYNGSSWSQVDGPFANFIKSGDENASPQAIEVYSYDPNWVTFSYDEVGWQTSNGAVPYLYLGDYPRCKNGILQGEQLVRYSTPAWVSDSYMRVYDSEINRSDFDCNKYSASSPMTHHAYNVASGTQTAISGRPALGAIISTSDGLSSNTTAYLVNYTTAAGGVNYPTAYFNIPNVATGTWSVFLSSGQVEIENSSVTISTGSTYVFPSTTTLIVNQATVGFISGQLLSANGTVLNPGITLSPGVSGNSTVSNTINGRYLLRVTTGPVDVVANPGNANASYVTISSLSVPVMLGVESSNVNFILSQGGRLSGFITRDGTNALPGIAVSVLDANGYARDQQVSGSDGHFTTIDVPTGTYTVEPALDLLETASPDSPSITVAAGVTTFVATYTVTGALGKITGTVMLSTAPLKTGALIIVTTTTLASGPPSLSSNTLTGSCFYAASSYEDGTFSIDVRQSTNPTYNVYGYYTSYSGQTPVITMRSVGNVSVTAGSTTALSSSLSW